ncbi:MAG: hypothetical protein KJP04_07980 [Arenicella sp.]|nr:hypothetical protein [Arenicella sp.]
MSTRSKHGHCPLCQRLTHLTFHHFVPRKVHRRAHFKKHFTKDQLNQGVAVCRQCHSGIHRFYDEMHLAKRLARWIACVPIHRCARTLIGSAGSG